MKKIPVWAIVLGVVVVIALWVMGSYNGLVSGKASVDNAWGNVEVQYQRRADVVPQLVATVKGAANFEQSTLTAVTEARTNWLNTTQNASATIGDQIAASQTFDSAMSRLLVSVEAYPNLTATASFQTLQAQIEGTENRIAVARKDFNDAATTYNVKVQRFPGNIIANLFGFDVFPLFTSIEGSATAPVIDFSNE